MKRNYFFAVFFVAALCGCGNNGSESSPSPTTATTSGGSIASVVGNRENTGTGAFADLDPWVLKTIDVAANRGNHGIYLSNGTLGLTLGASGGVEKNGVVYRAGDYDAKETYERQSAGEKVLAVEPAFEPKGKYTQSLDMRTGLLITESEAGTVTVFASADGRESVVKRQVSKLGRDKDVHSLARLRPGGIESPTAAPADLLMLEMKHAQSWAKNWQIADVTIEGDAEAQQIVHKAMFDLWQSARAGGDDSIAPEALSGDFYKGHIFWDAEIWMFPALLAQRPDLARTILDYRFKHLAQAKSNAKAQGFKGADFPWESAKSGKEVAPSGFATGRHVTAGVGWAHWQYYLVTQDKAWLAERGWPVLSSVAEYWASRAKKEGDGKFHIRNVYGPDELKGRVDDNTYTNALARYCLQAAARAAKIVGKPASPQWNVVANGLYLPFDKQRNAYLARANDDGRPTKQADGELTIYPANVTMPSKVAEATFDYHAARPIKNGPAMTKSIHALIAARLGRAGQADEFFRESYRPFLRGPFLLFSEKRSLDRCVFTTGLGGVLQSVIYGFGGVDYENWGDAMLKKPVTLPATWKKLTIKGLVRGAKRYTLTVTPQGRTLTEIKS